VTPKNFIYEIKKKLSFSMSFEMNFIPKKRKEIDTTDQIQKRKLDRK